MRAPSTTAPEVVVLDSTYEEKKRKETLNPKEDLWISSADGRYNSPMIPLRVGVAPYDQTFYVHKNILLKAEYFRKALCGRFKEAEAQAIDLPEEDPAIFHFIVAFLYEDKYVPIKPIASVLMSDEKGKGSEGEEEDAMSSSSESESSGGSLQSDSSTERSRRRRDRRRRREDRQWERIRQKHPNTHRWGCACRQCLSGNGPPCWQCSAPRLPPPPPPPPLPPNLIMVEGPDGAGIHGAGNHHHRHRHHHRRGNNNNNNSTNRGNSNNRPSTGDRLQGEDLRSWLLTYELNLDVYICANKFLLDGFKLTITRVVIDMLESAGADAAQPQVLEMCDKLYQGLPETDELLRMVFARVGFLQPVLWRNVPAETSDFLLGHPEVSALILKETVARRELDPGVHQLPAMERPFFMPPPPHHPGVRRPGW